MIETIGRLSDKFIRVPVIGNWLARLYCWLTDMTSARTDAKRKQEAIQQAMAYRRRLTGTIHDQLAEEIVVLRFKIDEGQYSYIVRGVDIDPAVTTLYDVYVVWPVEKQLIVAAKGRNNLDET